jgi:hypothetical protein
MARKDSAQQLATFAPRLHALVNRLEAQARQESAESKQLRNGLRKLADQLGDRILCVRVSDRNHLRSVPRGELEQAREEGYAPYYELL